MLQQDKPDDYVDRDRTRRTPSASSARLAFAHAGLDWREHVVVDPSYFRPTEVDLLLGDASKAKRELGWEPTTKFHALVKLMVDADLELSSQREKETFIRERRRTVSRDQACRVCGSHELRPLIDLGRAGAHGRVPARARRHVTEGPLELVKCLGERLMRPLQLRHTYEPTEMYGAEYGYRSSLNASMVRAPGGQGEVAPRSGRPSASRRRRPRHREQRRHDARVLPRDRDAHRHRSPPRRSSPSTTGRTSRSCRTSSRRRILPRERRASGPGSSRRSRCSTISIARSISCGTSTRSLVDGGIWHFEQSYLPAMLATSSYDTICHEHVEYYALAQIRLDARSRRLLDRATSRSTTSTAGASRSPP